MSIQAGPRTHRVDTVDPLGARAATSVGQAPTQVNLTIYQGDDFFLNVVVAMTSGVVDLTGYTPKAEIRTNAGAPTVLATFAAEIANANTVSLHLDHAQSTLLNNNAVWDIQITDPTGLVTTLACGTVTVMKQVTV